MYIYIYIYMYKVCSVTSEPIRAVADAFRP